MVYNRQKKMIKKSIFRVMAATAIMLTVSINVEAQDKKLIESKGKEIVTKPAPVQPKAPVVLTLSDTKVDLAVGGTKNLKVTSTLTAKETVTWKSSNANVVTVDKAGKITAKSVGTATITATAGSMEGKCEVKVKKSALSDNSANLQLIN